HGGVRTLLDTLTLTSTYAQLNLSYGTLDTNNQTLNCDFYSGSTSARTLILGASIWNCIRWEITYVTGHTIDAGTSSIRMTGLGRFQGGEATFNELQLNGTSCTIKNVNTFATLTRIGTATRTDSVIFYDDQIIIGTLTLAGNSAINRLRVETYPRGTAVTLTAAVVNVSNADFQDITGAGAGDWDLSAIAGLSGDCGGNTDITFTDPAAQYWHVDTGSWSDPTKWFLATDGGGGAGRVPLPQDDVYIDANSIDSGGKTITVDMPRIGKSIDFTGVLNSPTVSLSNHIYIYGSLTLVNGLTYNHN
ncbi:unnamed protein product, partial [marine sediment metagenome]